MNRGYTEVIDADLSKYFDTIPHANLMATVAERISDGAILHLIKMWLKAPIMEEDRDGTKRISVAAREPERDPARRGYLPACVQSLSAPVGSDLGTAQAATRLGAHLVRYADDFVVLCRRGRSAHGGGAEDVGPPGADPE